MAVYNNYENFDSREYLNKSWAEDSPKIQLLKYFHQELLKQDHDGGRLLDIGAGPSVHISLLASRVYTHITLAEYSDICRKQLRKWVDNDHGAYDWTIVASHISQLEHSTPDAVISRTRSCIKDILPCDLTATNPLLSDRVDTFDCVVVAASLECCSQDLQAYQHNLTNTLKLLKPSGKLILFGGLGFSFYNVSDETYHVLKMSEADIVKCIEGVGLKDYEIKTVNCASYKIKGDGYEYFFLTATNN